jgi:hypothetical protein
MGDCSEELPGCRVERIAGQQPWAELSLGGKVHLQPVAQCVSIHASHAAAIRWPLYSLRALLGHVPGREA